MGWLQPTRDERDFVARLSEEPHLYPLAQVLALAQRIEPLLLRNARLRFAPGSDTDLESEIWHHSMIYTRNAREVVIRAGIARALVDRLSVDATRFKTAWEFVDGQTRHWPARDRIELQMRLAAREQNTQRLRQQFRQILRSIQQTQNDHDRREMARWIKGALPGVTAPEQERSEEHHWLQQYVAAALGSPGKRLRRCDTVPEPLPEWLLQLLPKKKEHKLSLQLRPGVLECLKPTDGSHTITLSLPLPTPIVLRTDRETVPRWESLWPGNRIRIPRTTRNLTLQTLDGKQYGLKVTDSDGDNFAATSSRDAGLWLVHMPEDRAQAREIGALLEAQGIPVQLIEDSREDGDATTFPQAPVLRLWSRDAANHWRNRLPAGGKDGPPGLLLRTDAGIPLPKGMRETQVLDLPGWKGRADAPETERLLAAVGALLDGKPPADDTVTDEGESSAKSAPEFDALLREIDNPETTSKRRLAIGDRLAELGDNRPGVGIAEYEITRPTYTREIKRLLQELDDPKTKPERRLAIGNKLARPEDPRPGVGLDEHGLPDIDWVDIPAGGFIYQKREKLYLDAFQLARYPITNVQYQTFIDVGDYEDKRWWRGLKKMARQVPRWNQPNRPRETVSWYEAVAYCRWLSVQLGFEVRLPTEQEWEKAARGTDGREYPWGSGYRKGFANVDEKQNKYGPSYLEQTTAVGLYPQGASPYGVMDMAGNVWEWCLNEYDNPERTKVTGKKTRSVRGGSWYLYPDYVRAANRYWYYPDVRNVSIGFRVVRSSPITR